MRWQVKAALQGGLSRVPFGRQVFRRMQDVTGTLKLDIHDHYGRKSKLIRLIADSGLVVEGRDFLEVGTGWYPVLPFMLRALGARRVSTIDINPWLTPRSLEDTAHGLNAVKDQFARDFGVQSTTIDDLTGPILQSRVRNADDIRSILNGVGIDYRCPCDATCTDYASGEFDYVVSSNLLEHVPPDVINGMLVDSRRTLKLGGMHLHHINPGDHFAAGNNITTANFVRYGKKTWYWIGGSGLAYHNRLRAVDYCRMFEAAGFEIVVNENLVDERALAALQSGSLPVHADFANYASEQLACHVTDIFARLSSSNLTAVRQEPGSGGRGH